MRLAELAVFNQHTLPVDQLPDLAAVVFALARRDAASVLVPAVDQHGVGNRVGAGAMRRWF